MDPQQIKTILMQALELQEAHVTGESGHFQLIVVGEMFAGMRRLQRERVVYAPLMEYITDNRIHAVSIRALTPQEWQREKVFR